MTDLRKAAEMALEVLTNYVEDPRCQKEIDKAAEALRQALAEEAMQPWVKTYCGGKPNYTTPVDAVNMSQERVDETAEGEHEPFIYIREVTEMPFGGYEHCGQHEAGAFPVYTAPPKREYVTEVVAMHENGTRTIKQTLIQKREWVGLTDEEIYDYADKFLYSHGSNYGIRSFGKAIESKLKEKNGG